MAIVREMLNYLFSVGVISANSMGFLALLRMKSIKKSTVIFFAQLTLSNFVIGLVFLVRSICASLSIKSILGCQMTLVILFSSIMTYTLNLLFLSAELLVAMKRMGRTRTVTWRLYAETLSVLSWLTSAGVCFSGLAMRNTEMDDVPFSRCFATDLVFSPTYLVMVNTINLLYLVLVVTCYVLALFLLKKATKSTVAPSDVLSVRGSESSSDAEAAAAVSRTANLKRLKTHRKHLRVIVSIIVMVSLSWGIMALILYIAVICQSCNVATLVFRYFVQVLFIIPLFGNGIIYLANIPQFRLAFRQLFCCCSKKDQVGLVQPT